MGGTEATIYDLRDGAAWITLNRPERRNALSNELVSELYGHLAAANADDAVRAIVITGKPPAFCSGADLKNPPGKAAPGAMAVPYPDVLTAILESPKPVIAAVNGAAFAGGLGLVGAADIAICVEDAPFSFSEVRIGVIPAVIAVVCLRKLGTHHGMKLFLTGERFNGARAVEMGSRAPRRARRGPGGSRPGGDRHDRTGRTDGRGGVQETGAARAGTVDRRRIRRNDYLERDDVQRRGSRRGHGGIPGEAPARMGTKTRRGNGMSDIIRIGNCSGYYGDRLAAAREMVEGGPIDVLTGDYTGRTDHVDPLQPGADPRRAPRLRRHLPETGARRRRHLYRTGHQDRLQCRGA